MENDSCVEEKSCDGPTAVDQVKQPASTAPFRYTKVRRFVTDYIVPFPTQITNGNVVTGGASGNKKTANLK